MAEVYMADAPGGDMQVYECPYCSRSHPTIDEEGRPQECPNVCRRCGSPMDVEASRSFADTKAREVQKVANQRQRVKV